MDQFTTNFQFEIGELVYMKTARHDAENTPRKFMIIERLAQQCPNGVQLHYKLQPPMESPKVLELCISREMPAYEPVDKAKYEEALQAEYDMTRVSREAMEKMWNKYTPSEDAPVVPLTDKPIDE